MLLNFLLSEAAHEDLWSPLVSVSSINSSVCRRKAVHVTLLVFKCGIECPDTVLDGFFWVATFRDMNMYTATINKV